MTEPPTSAALARLLAIREAAASKAIDSDDCRTHVLPGPTTTLVAVPDHVLREREKQEGGAS